MEKRDEPARRWADGLDSAPKAWFVPRDKRQRPITVRMPQTTWAIFTGEFPPQRGGVADYTHQLATHLAGAGDRVHVFAPPCAEALSSDECTGDDLVALHRLPDHFGWRSRRMLNAALKQLPPDTRLLVQYVPQAFGARGMNIGWCRWLWRQARRSREIWTMFHEVAYPFEPGQALRHRLLAHVTHRMARRVARASTRTFVSIPAWGELIQPWTSRPPTWLPVPSNIATSASDVTALRIQFLSRGANLIVGHFGTFGGLITPLLKQTLVPVLMGRTDCVALLIGRGADEFAAQLSAQHPEFAQRLHSAAGLSARATANYLAACDLLVQPYPDGVSSRRSSLMAGLALGVPLLTTDGHLTEPLWRESGAVALAPTDDFPQLVATCQTLLDDTAHRRALGEAGRTLYAARFSIERTIDALRQTPEADR